MVDRAHPGAIQILTNIETQSKEEWSWIHKNTTDGNFLVKAELLYIYVIM